MMGAPSFEVQLSVATKMEKFNGRKQKLAKFSWNGRRTCAVRIKARSLPRQGLCLGAPSFPWLSSVKDLQTNQTEGNRVSEVFVWSARGRRDDSLDSCSLLGSKPNSKTTKLQVITTVVIGSPSASEPHCGLMPAQQARL